MSRLQHKHHHQNHNVAFSKARQDTESRSKIFTAMLMSVTLIWAGVLMAVMIAVVMPALSHAETPDQAKWVGDVPIMPALTIEKGLGFAFDNPEGRIVTIYLNGDAHPDQVMAYYKQALIPLGWVQSTPNIWQRRNETLTINKTPSALKDLWKIMLRPKP